MTISQRVQQQFFSAAASEADELIRLPPTVVLQYAKCAAEGTTINRTRRRAKRRTNLWSIEEHERFLRGLELFPVGPWKEVAAIVGTKTTRQTMTHAQKYRQKIERHKRGYKPKKARSKPCNASVESDDQQSGSETQVDEVESIRSSPAPDVDSPLDVAMDIFDHPLFDQDLSALLNSIDPIWTVPQTVFEQPEVMFSF